MDVSDDESSGEEDDVQQEDEDDDAGWEVVKKSTNSSRKAIRKVLYFTPTCAVPHSVSATLAKLTKYCPDTLITTEYSCECVSITRTGRE